MQRALFTSNLAGASALTDYGIAPFNSQSNAPFLPIRWPSMRRCAMSGAATSRTHLERLLQQMQRITDVSFPAQMSVPLKHKWVLKLSTITYASPHEPSQDHTRLEPTRTIQLCSMGAEGSRAMPTAVPCRQPAMCQPHAQIHKRVRPCRTGCAWMHMDSCPDEMCASKAHTCRTD